MNCVRVWDGLRMVEVENGIRIVWERLNELYYERKVEVQLRSEHRNPRR